jgi:hypothetical protein
MMGFLIAIPIFIIIALIAINFTNDDDDWY